MAYQRTPVWRRFLKVCWTKLELTSQTCFVEIPSIKCKMSYPPLTCIQQHHHSTVFLLCHQMALDQMRGNNGADCWCIKNVHQPLRWTGLCLSSYKSRPQNFGNIKMIRGILIVKGLHCALQPNNRTPTQPHTGQTIHGLNYMDTKVNYSLAIYHMKATTSWLMWITGNSFHDVITFLNIFLQLPVTSCYILLLFFIHGNATWGLLKNRDST